MILHLWSKFRINQPICRRDTARKRFSIWRPSAIMNWWNLDLFVRSPSSEWKFASVYQMWSKSDNSRLRYGDKAIFKMAAVRHLEFSKFAILVTWPISAWFFISDLNFALIGQYGAENVFSIWRPSAILDLLWRHLTAPETALYVSNFVLNFHDVRLRIFWNTLYFMFRHFGKKNEIAYFGLNFDDFWWK